MERRLDCFVERRVEIGLYGMGFVLSKGERREGGCIPGHAKAVHVEQAVAGCDFGFGCGLGVDSGVVG